MLCVSIAQTSQRLAIVDMFNASQVCDLIEIRLDRFEKAPDFHQLLERKFKPVVVSCRRVQDGGEWDGTEDARLALLRSAILAKADYVEIEVDVADKIRRYGDVKRIICYTNTREAPNDLMDVYRECLSQDPDVVKLTIPARTPEEAWPLIKIVAKATTPTVAVGWGRSGRLLSVLGKRYKAPWTYASLEKGMEAYPGMATIEELDKVFDVPNITGKTPFLGVAGPLQEQKLAAQLLNHGFRLAAQADPESKRNRTRCLPLEMGDLDHFQKVVDAVKLAGVLVDEANQQGVLRILHEQEETVRQSGACDFIAIQDEVWRGFSVLPRAVAAAVEEAMLARRPDEPAIDGKTFIVIGTSGAARGIATALRRKNAAVVIADPNNERAKKTAHEVGARYIPNGQVYSAICDGIILTPDLKAERRGVAAVPIPNSVARAGLLAVDLTNLPYVTPFLNEVRVLGGLPISPLDLFIRKMQMILKAYTGQTLSFEQLKGAIEEDADEYNELAPDSAT